MIKEDNIRIQITMSKKIYAALEDLSRETGISKSDIINISLIEKLTLIQMDPNRWTKPQ